MAIETDSRFWDCECKDDYIHSKTVTSCMLCGAFADEQPDSRTDEIQSQDFLDDIGGGN